MAPRREGGECFGERIPREAQSAAHGFAYVVAHSDGGGRKLAKFADPAKALIEAKLKATQLNAGLIEGASMSFSDRAESGNCLGSG